MNENIIPDNIKSYFIAKPNIGRYELSKQSGISESEARFYCKLFKKEQKDVYIMDVGIAAWDIHHPYHDDRCISCLFQVIKDIKPSIFILGGDNMDFNTISYYNRHKPKLVEGSRIGRDYKRFYGDILFPLNEILGEDCEKYFMFGNHEERIDRLIESQPNLEGLIEVEKNLPLEDWIVKKYKDIITFGHMNFSHGLYWNKYHSNKTVQIYQKNIFYGHVHTHQVYTSISPINCLPKQAVSVGCLCNRNAEYKKEEPNHWVNQFLIFYLLSDGSFRYNVVTILNGRCVVDGKLYDGN